MVGTIASSNLAEIKTVQGSLDSQLGLVTGEIGPNIVSTTPLRNHQYDD